MSDLDRYLDRLDPADEMEAHRREVQAQTWLREVFLNLVKRARTSRLYGGEHHHARRFLDAFIESLTGFLEEYEVAVIDVEPDEFRYHGNPVLHHDSLGEQLVYGLYTEGLRGISLERAASRRELARLADLLSTNWLQREDEDEDLLTAAWRAELEHVHLEVADRFAEEDGEGGDAATRDDLALGRSAGSDPRHHGGDSVLLPEIQGLLRELEADAVRADEAVKMKQDEAELFLRLRDELAELAGVPPEEDLLPVDEATRTALQKEAAIVVAEEDCPTSKAGEVLFELLRQEDRPEAAEELGGAVARHLLDAIETGGTGAGSDLLRRTLALMDRDLFPSFAMGAAYRRGLAELVGEARRRRLAAAMDRLESRFQEVAGQLFTMLSAMPPSAASDLVALGTAIEVPAMRQVVADAVVEILDSRLDAMLDLLERSRGPSAVVPLLGLGRMGAARAVEPCLARAHDELPEVREAALRSLRGSQSPRIRQAMLASLVDPEEGVRREALRYLAVYRDPDDLQALEAGIRSPEMDGRSEDEQRAWLTAFALVGRDLAVPFLRGILLQEHASPFQGAEGAAVAALARIGGSSSREALDLAGRRRPELRKAIRQVLAPERKA